MNKRHILSYALALAIAAWGFGATSCSGSSDDGHGHETHENHDHYDHDADDHDDHDGHDHDGHDHEDHEGHDHGDAIKLKTEVAKRFGVVAEIVNPSEFVEVLQVSGQIETKASDEGIATATRNGILTLSPNVTTGLKVASGTSLGSVSVKNIQGADPASQARATREAAKRELDRITPLYKDGIVSTQQYNEALKTYEEAEAALKNVQNGSGSISSPRAGVITQLLAKSGEYVEVGQPIAVISGNTSLTLRADVPEKYYDRLAAVTSANFRPAYADETLSLKELDGRLVSSPMSSSAKNGYIPVYFTFSNNGAASPGSFAEVYLLSGSRHDVIAVPKEAIVEIQGNKCVYSEEGDGLYAKHVVKTGATDGKRVEILSGLPAGEKVVVKGAQVVRMAETSSAAVPGHTHNH